MTTTTFRDAYGVLQRHAETLRNQQEPNIDDLLTIVNESVSAYKVCKKRIDAVEKALEQALGNVGVDSGAFGEVPPDVAPFDTPESHPNHPANADSDDDIPF
jgi:exodeoxyribonuclease VII small subunit